MPPIGAVLILDQLVLRRSAHRPLATVRVRPFLAWAIGALGAALVHYRAPHLSEAIAGLVVGALAYALLELLTGSRTPGGRQADARLVEPRAPHAEGTDAKAADAS